MTRVMRCLSIIAPGRGTELKSPRFLGIDRGRVEGPSQAIYSDSRNAPKPVSSSWCGSPRDAAFPRQGLAASSRTLRTPLVALATPGDRLSFWRLICRRHDVRATGEPRF